MWKLPSGKLVEEVLYEAFKNKHEQSLGHSFIIDINEPKVQRLFNSGDWQAILEKEPRWPESDESLVEMMSKFLAVSQCMVFSRCTL